MIEILRRLFKRSESKNTPTNEPKNGKWKEFNKHAVMISEGHYVNGVRDGIWKFYYDSGELLIEEEYDLGKKSGKYCSYFRNGNPMSNGRFTDDQRQGEFKVFSEQGKLTRVLIFKNDNLIEDITPPHRTTTPRQLTYDLPMVVVFITYMIYWSIQLG